MWKYTFQNICFDFIKVTETAILHTKNRLQNTNYKSGGGGQHNIWGQRKMLTSFDFLTPIPPSADVRRHRCHYTKCGNLHTETHFLHNCWEQTGSIQHTTILEHWEQNVYFWPFVTFVPILSCVAAFVTAFVASVENRQQPDRVHCFKDPVTGHKSLRNIN